MVSFETSFRVFEYEARNFNTGINCHRNLLLKEFVADEDETLDGDMENLQHSVRNSLDGADGSPEFSSSWRLQLRNERKTKHFNS